MKILTGSNEAQVKPTTKLLLQRMLCPFSGLSSEISFVMRGALEPKIFLAVGEITGTHLPREGKSLRTSTLHIAGVGTSYEEAIIKVLAESIERYAQFSWFSSKPQKIVFASYQTMRDNSRVLIPESLQYFSESQLTRLGFPFSRLQPDMAIGWIPAKSLTHGTVCWLPAQIALVSYVMQDNEPLFMFGVTTGTAAHRTLHQALRNALLEMIQIDAAMGNWYGNHSPVLIQHDDRTRGIKEIIDRSLHQDGPTPRFYWLPNADLPGLTIACVVENQEIPKFAVGLGCDLCLTRAIYKAFLEAVAVAQLAKVNCLIEAAKSSSIVTNPSEIYDLDSNVVYYATEGRSEFHAKFGIEPVVAASDLPEDVNLGIKGDVRYLVESFTTTEKELVFVDLTTTDIQYLGFCVARVWSPDTISLSPPSAPPVMHPRFEAYGGIMTETPHPYP